MNKAISVEMQFFLISILWGAILLLGYDTLRILRRLINHNGFFLAVEDLIFWVTSSVFIFAMMYHENSGIIRGFSVMGMGIGMVLYHEVFSEWLVETITMLIKTLMKPFSIAYHWVKRFLLFWFGKVKKIAKFILTQLKKVIISVRIALNKRKQKAALEHKKNREKKLQEQIQKEERKMAEKQKKAANNDKKTGIKQTKLTNIHRNKEPHGNNRIR